MNEKEKSSPSVGLSVVHHGVAGIDIGSREHWVAGPQAEDGGANVQRFKTTSDQLMKLVEWLQEQHVKSVAMESTGLYWVPVFELLDSRGIEVVLVNAKDFHHAPGRPKTDKLDCQWLQRLHSCGLLRGSFRPDDGYVRLRTLVRQRANLVSLSTRYVQWMQKSLDQMNVQVHHAVSDLSGVTGMAIVRAIVAGERNPTALASLRHETCRKSAEEIAKHLTGTWRDEHLFTLASTLRLYDENEKELAAYDAEIAKCLDAMQLDELKDECAPKHPTPSKEKRLRTEGMLPLRDRLWRAIGKDLTRIDGINTAGAQVILSELGTDLSSFPNEGHFVSWLRLCPPTNITGGKARKKKRNGLGANRVAGVLRMAALGVSRTKTALGAYFRRIARTKDYAQAIFITARKIAEHVYRLLRHGQQYVDIGEQALEARYQERRIKILASQAKTLGLTLVPTA